MKKFLKRLTGKQKQKDDAPPSRTDILRSRQVRVFISSTFRDMQQERNYLVKHVFPELRKKI